MSNIITMAFSAEGTTDQRFLESIIKRTFEEVAFQCEGLIEVYDPIYIKFPKRFGFVQGARIIAMEAFKAGINILCVHVDADDKSDSAVIQQKIDPAFKAIAEMEGDACKNVVAIIPIYMSEAWMLADKDLLKAEIDTEKSDEELGFLKDAESIPDPKNVIKSAIRTAQSHLSRRRNKITISDLYQPMGQKIPIVKLEELHSYKNFKSGVENAFRQLNYLH
jgi:hypothetical protein